MNKVGLRVAVIVNDMAEVNVDALSVNGAQLLQKEEKMVELSNGCICCTLREDLLTSLASLAAENRFDYVVIESSGISEPLPVAETFTFEDESGMSLGSVAQLENLVTVVDGSAFLRELACVESLQDRGWEAAEEDERRVAHLLADQVEFADLLILNKTDVMTEEERGKVHAVLKRSNPRAEILETSYGRIDPQVLFGQRRFNFTQAEENPKWLKEARVGEHTAETEEYGISSFILRARRPFHPERLSVAVKAMESREGVLGQLVRMKGVSWLASRNGEQSVMQMAGYRFSVVPGPPWWAAIPREEWPEGLSEDIKPLWQEPHGDRQIEIVCIGQAMDKVAVEEALRACLLTDDELLAVDTWSSLVDPFLVAEPPVGDQHHHQQHHSHQQHQSSTAVRGIDNETPSDVSKDVDEKTSLGSVKTESRQEAETIDAENLLEPSVEEYSNATIHLDIEKTTKGDDDGDRERLRKQAEFLKKLPQKNSKGAGRSRGGRSR